MYKQDKKQHRWNPIRLLTVGEYSVFAFMSHQDSDRLVVVAMDSEAMAHCAA